MLAIYVPDEISAFRMFETLNDRGLRASQADILKNYFFSKVANRLSEAKSMWTTMTAIIELPVGQTEEDDDDDDDYPSNRGDPLVTYIRHSWITTHGPTKERELAEKIRFEVTNDTRSMQFLAECSSAASDYVALSSPRHPKWAAYKSSTRNNIETIAHHLQVVQIKPLLFAVARHFDPIEADKAFRLFVSWSVRFLIVGGRGGMLDTQYSLRAKEVGKKEVTKARDLREAMKKYVPSDSEFEQAFAVARVSRPHIARYYLRALEKTQKQLPQPEYVANEDVAAITLEHVMPLEPGRGWKVSPDVARAAQKLLGNMALVRESVNRDLGNRPFSEKRPVLDGSGYDLTRWVAEHDEWDLPQIQERQARMAKLAVQTWTLDLID